MQKIISTNPRDTIKFGKELVSRISAAGSVIALSGEMGAGKTVLTKGVAAALGVTDEVTSPTFALVKSYIGLNTVLHHFDAYRLSGAEEAEDSGLCDLIGVPDSICVIEWPERIRELLPQTTVWVEMNRIDEMRREIIIRNC